MRQTKNSLINSQIRELCGLAENGEPLEKIIKAMKTFEGHEGIGQKFMKMWNNWRNKWMDKKTFVRHMVQVLGDMVYFGTAISQNLLYIPLH